MPTEPRVAQHINDPVVPIILDIIARLDQASSPLAATEAAALAFEVAIKLITTRCEYVVALASLCAPFTRSELQILDAWIAANPLEVRDD